MKPKRYPSDLTKSPWRRLKRLLPPAKPGGRPRSVKLREVLNGIFSILRGGCAWRMMPTDRPPWSPGSDYVRTGRNDGTGATINDALRTQVRPKDQRTKRPSRGIIDRPSVTTTEQGGPHGQDAFKKVKGRKRHLVVDTLGMVMAAVVHAAGIPDRDGAKRVLPKMVGRFPRRKTILTDGISHGGIAEGALEVGGWIREMVVHPQAEEGADPKETEKKEFQVLKWRWIVERTFAGLGRYRRLSKDYEGSTESSESWIYLAMTHLMLRRLDPA